MTRVDQGSLEYMQRRAKTFKKLPHRERRKHIRRQRRSALRDLPILYEVLVLLYGRRCAVCGACYNLTIDHILPVSRGGRTVIENMQILCSHCNRLKDAEIMDFREE